MNIRRLVGAGLLAGLVLNIGEAVLHGAIFADATVALYTELGREIAGAGSDTAQLILLTFIQGLLGVLLYAAVQPRWKAGPATAIRVGLILWVLSAVYSAAYLGAGFARIVPASLAWGPVGFELVLYPLAIFTGSLLYKER